MSEEISLLPLGTAISLQENNSVYIVISKGLTRQPDGQFLANYTVILPSLRYNRYPSTYAYS